MYSFLISTNMEDEERRLLDLIQEYYMEKQYYDNLMSKAAVVMVSMKEILKKMEEMDDE